jgi:hypothetical protein
MASGSRWWDELGVSRFRYNGPGVATPCWTWATRGGMWPGGRNDVCGTRRFHDRSLRTESVVWLHFLSGDSDHGAGFPTSYPPNSDHGRSVRAESAHEAAPGRVSGGPGPFNVSGTRTRICRIYSPMPHPLGYDVTVIYTCQRRLRTSLRSKSARSAIELGEHAMRAPRGTRTRSLAERYDARSIWQLTAIFRFGRESEPATRCLFQLGYRGVGAPDRIRTCTGRVCDG